MSGKDRRKRRNQRQKQRQKTRRAKQDRKARVAEATGTRGFQYSRNVTKGKGAKTPKSGPGKSRDRGGYASSGEQSELIGSPLLWGGLGLGVAYLLTRKKSR